MIVVIDQNAYHSPMKYSFNNPDAVLFVFAILAIFALVQSIPGLDFSEQERVDVTEVKQQGESYIAPVSYNKNNYIKDFSKVEIKDIKTSYLLGNELFGPDAQEPAVMASVDPETVEKPIEKAVKVAPKYDPIIPDGTPKIAIIIDDMGVSYGNSVKTIELDAPLTLAFLPYADGLPKMTADADTAGHELMIHMPMQAMTNPVSLGPIAIKAGMSADEVHENMEAAFETFEGYEGLNNHMGSKATQDPALMSAVMESLKERGLFFVDSRTISSSVAAETAREYGLPVAVRDVFLDHEDTPEFVSGALRKLERIAAKKGHAIAIGHPKNATIQALQKWLPDAQKRGFEIVHVSELLERPSSSTPPRVAAVLTTSPERTLSREMARIRPAVGDEEAQAEKVETEAQLDKDSSDPNSAQAREAILKALLGQKESQ